jgi:hypothetical protein
MTMFMCKPTTGDIRIDNELDATIRNFEQWERYEELRLIEGFKQASTAPIGDSYVELEINAVGEVNDLGLTNVESWWFNTPPEQIDDSVVG